MQTAAKVCLVLTLIACYALFAHNPAAAGTTEYYADLAFVAVMAAATVVFYSIAKRHKRRAINAVLSAAA